MREAYRLRGRHDLARLAPYEMGSIATFLRYAYHVVGIALENAGTFGTVDEFVASIDSLKQKIG